MAGVTSARYLRLSTRASSLQGERAGRAGTHGVTDQVTGGVVTGGGVGSPGVVPAGEQLTAGMATLELGRGAGPGLLGPAALAALHRGAATGLAVTWTRWASGED